MGRRKFGFDGGQPHIAGSERVGLTIPQRHKHTAVTAHPDLAGGAISIGSLTQHMHVRMDGVADQARQIGAVGNARRLIRHPRSRHQIGSIHIIGPDGRIKAGKTGRVANQ